MLIAGNILVMAMPIWVQPPSLTEVGTTAAIDAQATAYNTNLETCNVVFNFLFLIELLLKLLGEPGVETGESVNATQPFHGLVSLLQPHSTRHQDIVLSWATLVTSLLVGSKCSMPPCCNAHCCHAVMLTAAMLPRANPNPNPNPNRHAAQG